MEDINLTPDDLPEDMPELSLDSFRRNIQSTDETPLEPLCEPPVEAASGELEVPEASALEVPNHPHEEFSAEEPVQDLDPIIPEPQKAYEHEVFAEAEDFALLDVPEDDPIPVSDPEPLPPTPAPIPESPAPELSDTQVFPIQEPTNLSDTQVFYVDRPNKEPILKSTSDAEQVFADIGKPAAPTPAAKPKSSTSQARPVRKSRPKRKRGDGLWGIPHLLATCIWLAIILAIGVSLGRMLWLCAADVLAFGRDSKEVVITINANDSIDDIAEKLHDKGLIKYPGLFKLYADIAVDDGEIAPGTYTLDTILDYHALVGSMSSSSSSRAVVEDVLIPEGFSCRQIFELLEQNGICTVSELEEYAANGEFQDFWFLEGVKRGDKYCLEGFLFPDTYDFYAGSTPREALGKMLLGFNARINQEEVTAKLVTLNERISDKMKRNGCSEEFIAEHQFTLYDLLTVASLIEEETAGASESPTIASVIFNRLTQNEIYERYLGIDAAIIYATGDAENIDTSIDSPYNTYTNAGLTPTPISNPGLNSIEAALEFADTDYYYYVLNPETQLHQFSKTYEEHQKWIEQFRGTAE